MVATFDKGQDKWIKGVVDKKITMCPSLASTIKSFKGVAVELKTPCFNGSLLEPSLVAIQLVMLTK